MQNKESVNDIIKPVLTKASLIEKVERLVRTDGIKYTEALMHLCTEYEVEPEDIAKLISPPLKSKMKIEAENLNYLPKTSGNTLF